MSRTSQRQLWQAEFYSTVEFQTHVRACIFVQKYVDDGKVLRQGYGGDIKLTRCELFESYRETIHATVKASYLPGHLQTYPYSLDSGILEAPPKVVSWQAVNELGWPLPVDVMDHGRIMHEIVEAAKQQQDEREYGA